MTLTRHTETSEVYLTHGGRRSLAARARLLQDEVIPRLTAPVDNLTPADAAAEREAVDAELAEIHRLLATARSVDALPDDPEVVELGETVTIRVEGLDPQDYMVVDPCEALVGGGARVSALAPLGKALLGRRIGDEVEVPAPGGHYLCTIERVTRPRPTSAPRARRR